MIRCRFMALQSHNLENKRILLIIQSKLRLQNNENSKCLPTFILQGQYLNVSTQFMENMNII